MCPRCERFPYSPYFLRVVPNVAAEPSRFQGISLSTVTCGLLVTFTIKSLDSFGAPTNLQRSNQFGAALEAIENNVRTSQFSIHRNWISAGFRGQLVPLYTNFKQMKGMILKPGALAATFYSTSSLDEVSTACNQNNQSTSTCVSCLFCFPQASSFREQILGTRWLGFVRPILDVPYQVFLNVTDQERVQLWIDNIIIIDQWTSLGNTKLTALMPFDIGGNFYEISLKFTRASNSPPVTSLFIEWAAINSSTTSIASFALYSASMLADFPLPVTVEPAQVCSSKCTISGLSLGTAGAGFRFFLVGKDSFGNIKPEQQFFARLRRNADISILDPPAVCVVDDTASTCLSKEIMQADNYQLKVHSIHPGGLLAFFFSDCSFLHPILQRIDNVLDFGCVGYDTISPNTLCSFCSARWVGYVSAPVTDEYTFIVLCNCIAELFFDDLEMKLESMGSGLGFRVTPLYLVKGVHYSLELRCSCTHRPVFIQLRWKSSMFVSEQIISHENLFNSGEPVSNSPLNLLVLPNIVCASLSIPRGSSLTICTAGKVARISILARDEYQNKADSPNNFALRLTQQNLNSPSREFFFYSSSWLSLNSDDGFAPIEYSLTCAGAYSVDVYVLFQNGIRATYYSDPVLSPAFSLGSEIASTIDWSTSNAFILNNAKEFPKPVLSAVWSGFLKPHLPYHFMQAQIYSLAERIKVWVDGAILIDQWASLDSLTMRMPIEFDYKASFYFLVIEYTSSANLTNRGLSIQWESSNDIDLSLVRAPLIVPSESFYTYERVEFQQNSVFWNGLWATFYGYSDSSDPLSTLLFENVDFSDLGSYLGSDIYSADHGITARWSGYIRPQYMQDYTFYSSITESDERVRLWIDNNLIIDQWTSLETLDASHIFVFECFNSRQGHYFMLDLEYQDYGGANGVSLLWKSAGANNVPREVLGSKYLWRSSPFLVQSQLLVTPNSLCIARCTASGNALTLSTAGGLATFSIEGKDQFDNGINIQGLSVIVFADIFVSPTKSPFTHSYESLHTLGPNNFPHFTSVTRSGQHTLFLGSILRGGLSATYFSFIHDTVIPYKSTIADTVLSFEFEGGFHSSDSEQVFQSSDYQFITRWEGFIYPSSTALYTFSTFLPCLDDRIILWVNDILILEQWSSLSTSAPYNSVRLNENVSASFKVVLRYRTAKEKYALYLQTNETARSTIRPSTFGYLSQFRGSPFTHNVVPSVTCASMTKASGVGLTMVTVGSVATFMIQAYDEYQNMKSIGGDLFVSECRSIRTGMVSHGILSDFRNGSYLMSVPAFTLVDSYVLYSFFLVGGGLQATYYEDSSLSFPLKSEVFTTVSLFHLESSLLTSNFLTDNSIFIRWSGYIMHEVGTSMYETYTYYIQLLQPDDRVRLWIDNMLIIDQWASRLSQAPTGLLNVTRNDSLLSIDIWYEHTYGDAFFELNWHSSVTRNDFIPSFRLFESFGLSEFPITVTSMAGAYCSASSIAVGEGLTLIRPCAASTFAILVRDAYYNPVLIDKSQIFVRAVVGNLSNNISQAMDNGFTSLWQINDEMALFDDTVDSTAFLDFGLYFVPTWYIVTFNSILSDNKIRVSLVNGPDLAATFYAGTDFNQHQAIATALFRELDFSSADWPSQYSSVCVSQVDGFSVRWAGYLRPTGMAIYSFYFSLGHAESLNYNNQEVVVTNERVRIWIDGGILIDQWTSLGSTMPSGTIVLQAVLLYDIQIDYKHYVLSSDGFIPNPYSWILKWTSRFYNSTPVVITEDFLLHGNDIPGSPFSAALQVPVIAVSGPGNGPTTGGTALHLLGAGFGDSAECRISVYLSDTVVASSIWLSSTSLASKSPPGIAPGHNITVVAGNLRSVPALFARFSYDSPLVSITKAANGPASGNALVMIGGNNLGTYDSTPRARVGGTSCESTTWISNFELECKLAAGDGVFKEVVITVQGQIGAWGTLSGAFSYDFAILPYASDNFTSLKGNMATTGSSSISVFGSNFGLLDACPRARLGGTSSETSNWVADSFIVSKIPSGTATFKDLTLTLAATPVNSILSKLRSFSYDQPAIVVVNGTNTNAPTFGSVLLTVLGSNLATDNYSPGARAGVTASATVLWISDSAVYCMIEAGISVDWGLEMSVGRQSGCASHSFTYDLPSVFAVTFGNSPLAGTMLLNMTFLNMATLFGSSFGTSDFSASIRIGGTSCTATEWLSDSEISCHVAAGIFMARDMILMLALRTSVTRSQALSYDSFLISAVFPKNTRLAGLVSLSVAGLNFGTYSTSFYSSRIGVSGATRTAWISDSFLTLKTGPGRAATWTVAITVGLQSGIASATKVFSFDTPAISSLTKINSISSSVVSLSTAGANFGISDSSNQLRTGSSSCQATIGWSSDTAVFSKSTALLAMTTRVSLSISEVAGTASRVFSADSASLSAANRANQISSGSILITLQARGLGIYVASEMIRGAQSSAEQTDWHSDTCLSAYMSEGRFGSGKIVLSAGIVRASGSSLFSFVSASASGLRAVNTAATGFLQVSINGNNMGLVEFSPKLSLGRSSAEKMDWISDSSVSCHNGGAYLKASLRISVSSGNVLGCRSSAFSTDFALTCDFQRTNVPKTGSAIVTLFGSGFGQIEPTGVCIAEWTSSEKTAWISDSAMHAIPAHSFTSSRGISLSVGSTRNSITFGLSFEGPAASSIKGKNCASTGSYLISWLGSGFGLDFLTFGARVGISACRQTSWASETTIICNSVKVHLGTLRAILTLSQKTASRSNGFTTDKVAVSVMSQKNSCATGSQVVTLYGLNFDSTDTSPNARLSNPTGSEQSIWTSATSLLCQTNQGISKSRVALISLAIQVGTMTRGVSAEVGTVSRAGSSNQASTGSVSVTLLGQGFGVESWSRAAGLGATVCEMSRWTSGTAIVCRAAQEVRGSRASQVTVGMVAGSCTAGYSVGGGRVSVPVQGNAGTTGAASVTIRGGGFGLSFFSGSVWTGQTSCESTWWLGDTFVLCHGANGVGQSRRVWTTVGMRVGSLTRAMSWDRATASALSSNNRMVTGSGQVTVFGARMGRSMTCMPLRIFGTAAEQTVWASDTCLEVLSGQGWLRSGRVGMTVGEHMASTSRSFSYVAYVMSVVLPGNVVGSGSSVITVLGAGMGLVDGTAKTRVGVTACEVTGWMSQTAMRCLLGDSFRGSLRSSLTLGARVGSGTNAYSVGSGLVSVVKRANTPVTGTVVVSVTGSNMKAVGLSGGGRAWQSGFEVSTWVSDSCVRAQAGSAVGRSQRMSVTTGTRVGSVTRGFSSDRAAGSAVRRSNVATTGSLMLSLQGTRLGAFDTSWAARLSRSSCERSVWDSDTSVRVRTGDSVQGSRRVVLTSGRVVGSMSRGVSAEKGRMSLVTACNAGSTGSASMTVHGAGLGRGSFTSAFRFGKTSCRVTGWISDSVVVCNSPAASLASRRVSVSVGVNVVTTTRGFSVEIAYLSIAVQHNTAASGSFSLTLLGAGFSFIAQSCLSRLGRSSASRSWWASDTALSVKETQGLLGSKVVLVTSGILVASLTNGFTFNMLSASGISGSNGPASGDYSLSVAGLNFGANRCQIILLI